LNVFRFSNANHQDFERLHLKTQELVETINGINDIFDTINHSLGISLLLVLSINFIGGVITMFMLAHKVSSHVDIFIDNEPVILFIICIIYVQYKFFVISYLSYRAYEKV